MPNLILIIQQICAIIQSIFLKTQLLLVQNNLTQITLTIMSIMKRYMKQGRINFFQSPHPRHIDFNNLRENRFHFEEDVEIHEQRLFLTPVRCNTATNQSPYLNIDPYFTQNPSTSRRLYSEDVFLQNSQGMENQQQQQSLSSHGINQKVDFSEEEELLIPLTPQKVAVVVEEENQNTATAKKNYSLQNSLAMESKFYQRGLKKLAYQAFQFVSHQKKTTYKQVAKRLISQINDENEFDVHKKGQMNIKRRVYDALNVLIALGLLKRNGNKILGKKSDSQAIFLGKQTEKKQNQKKKEEALQSQLKSLKNEYQGRLDIMKQKQITIQSLKEKMIRIRDVTNKNKEQNHKSNRKDFVKMPFFGICLGDMFPIHPSGDNMTINQENQQILQLSFNQKYKIQLLGDLDLIQKMKHSSQHQPNQKQRSKRLKQK